MSRSSELFSMLHTIGIPAAAAAGILSHVAYFIRGEHHVNGPLLLCIYVALAIVIFFWQSTSGGSNLSAAFQWSAAIITVYVVSLFGSMITYRCLLHPLRSFPGPFGARVTKFWHAYHIWDSKNHLLLHRLHQEYGDFVRTGMHAAEAPSARSKLLLNYVLAYSI